MLNVHSPYSGELIATLHRTMPEEVELAFQKASAVFANRKQWLTPHERCAVLKKFHQLVQDEADVFIKTAIAEGGKPLVDTQAEFARALQGIDIAIAELAHLKGEQIAMNLTPSSLNRRAYTFREPVGVVFAISAFNHPINLIIHQIVPAIATGCPVIVRPASATPLSCLKLVELAHKAGLAKAWCQAILCDSQTAENYVSDERVSYLSFIGSANVGWRLKALLARGASCALEHGGVAPVVVTPSAKLAVTIPLLVKGGFYHAGQVCVSVQRIYAERSIYEEVCRELAAQASLLKVGDPHAAHTEVGPLISKQEIERIHAWVTEAITQGAQLLCGGQVLQNQCYAPTVLKNPPKESLVSKAEVFGPVVCVYPYDDLAHAIEQANSLPYQFQAAIFTNDLTE